MGREQKGQKAREAEETKGAGKARRRKMGMEQKGQKAREAEETKGAEKA